MGNKSVSATNLRTPQRVAILDAGAQYGGLIDRTIRELGLRTVLLPIDTPAKQLETFAAIVISGGPKSVAEADAYHCDPDILNIGKPILGICYGLQLIAQMHGGSVDAAGIREDGPQDIEILQKSALFKGLAKKQRVLMTHGITVLKEPAGFQITARSGSLIAAIENEELRQYGVQFHPEVYQTECGKTIFKNFLLNIAELVPDYTPADQEHEAIAAIKSTVGDHDVVVFVSGGVDSTVVAALIGEAIPKSQIHAFHTDTGFMRLNESKKVVESLENAGIKVTLLDMADMFANATAVIDGKVTKPLKEVIDPQIKRQIIGDTFIKVREKILRDYNLTDDSVLAQGSLRPDLIESGSELASTKAETIKTHHNDTEEVRKLRRSNRVIEPLQQLYKDQVRELGTRLGLPADIVDRHPFPGPGLAIRVICSEQPYRLMNHDAIQQQLDDFVTAKGFGDFQVHLLPVQTVGVQGDGRSYKYLAGITGPADWEKLSHLAALIPNYNQEINRLVYIFGGPVERDNLGITPTHLTKDVLDGLRLADDIVTATLRDQNLMSHISQLPVILFPVDFGKIGQRSIALRPFITPDFMTGLAALPNKDIPEAVIMNLVAKLTSQVPGISRIVYDLSSKPPGTTEWE